MSYSSMTPSKGFEGMEAGTPTAGRRRGDGISPRTVSERALSSPDGAPSSSSRRRRALFSSSRRGVLLRPPPRRPEAPRGTEKMGRRRRQPPRCKPRPVFSPPHAGRRWQETEENQTRGFNYLLRAAEAGDRQSMILVARAFDTGQNLSPDRYRGCRSGRCSWEVPIQCQH